MKWPGSGSLFSHRQNERRETSVYVSLAHRAIGERLYEAAMRVGVQGLPLPDRSPLALDWDAPEMFALEAILADAVQLSALRQQLKGHEARVTNAAFDTSGQRIITASDDGTARIWDRTSGKQTARIPAAEGMLPAGDQINQAVLAPGGQSVLTASNHGLNVWDIKTGARLHSLTQARAVDAAYSPDGARIVAAVDSHAEVYDQQRGGAPLLLRGHQDFVYSVNFSNAGDRIITASRDGTARIWNAVNGAELRALAPGGGYVYYAAFSADGRLAVTASFDGLIHVLDAASGELLLTLKGHTGKAYSAAFSPDGARILTASADGTARIWDARTGVELFQLRGHGDWVYKASFNAGGTEIVTASVDRTVRVWDARVGQSPLQLAGHSGRVVSAAFNRDGSRVVTASQDRTAHVWDSRTGARLAEISGGSPFTSAAFDAAGTSIVTAADDGMTTIWDAATGSRIRRLEGHSVAGTPAGTADGSSASWTVLSAPTMGCPRNRVNSTPRVPTEQC